MSPLSRLRRAVGQLLFERRYGVRTAELIELGELGIDGENRGYYVPASWRTLRRTLPRRSVGERDVFIDFGSGMGRMVLEAARYPFRKVIGVELSDRLHEIARQNVARTRQRLRCRDIDLVRGDVLEYPVPDDVTVVFFNNPFQGAVFTTVIERLLESVDRNPRPLKIIYYNPVEEAAILGTGRFDRVRTIAHARQARAGSPFGWTRVYTTKLG
ncbi:methyltransferase domain-containing protein [Amycolatopsis anabasis]|uniref:methyltransferase domain-containing protein n=1 Tax=Amycolatopsis anabasis TaxID=1840409 RepID=UPI00131E8623|nr:class I SAM-dependent methyltransferase [Amycolatopsis anabasis]